MTDERPNPAPENQSAGTDVGLHPEVLPVPPDQGFGYTPRTSDEVLRHTHADTARRLAYGLLLVLSGTIAVNYFCVSILLGFGKREEAKALEPIFNTVMPILSGLAGSAATYYFTRDNRP